MKLRLVVPLIVLPLVLSGCAVNRDKLGFVQNESSKSYQEAYEPVRQALWHGYFDQVHYLLNQNSFKQVEQEFTDSKGKKHTKKQIQQRSDVEEMQQLMEESSELAIVERGLLTLNLGDYQRALHFFNAAEKMLELNVPLSYDKNGNPIQHAIEHEEDYILRGYEKVMILNYKALCYLLMGDRKAYNVTRRAIDYQQEEWERAQKKLALNQSIIDQRVKRIKNYQRDLKKWIKQHQAWINSEKNTIREQKSVIRRYKTSNPYKADAASKNIAEAELNLARYQKKLGELEFRLNEINKSPYLAINNEKAKREAGLLTNAYVNPFADYLNGMMMEFDGFDDATMRQNARISYNKVVELNPQCKDAKLASRTVDRPLPERYKLVHVILADGFAPIWQEKRGYYTLKKTNDTLIRWAEPVEVLTRTEGARVLIGRVKRPFSPLTRMSSIVRTDLFDNMLTDSIVGVQSLLVSGTAGLFASELEPVLEQAKKKPEIRSWLTLPQTVYVARIAVPKKRKEIVIQTLDKEGRVLASRECELSDNGPTVIYAVSYDKHMIAFKNGYSWVN